MLTIFILSLILNIHELYMMIEYNKSNFGLVSGITIISSNILFGGIVWIGFLVLNSLCIIIHTINNKHKKF